MKRLVTLIILIGLVSLVLPAFAPVYAGEGGLKIGMLTMTPVPGSGKNLIIKSSRDITAVFKDTKGKEEYYIGEIGIKLGVDLSIKGEGQFQYAVIALSSDYKTGSYALQGRYFGQKVGVGANVGVGVQLLIGGFKKSFSLQPFGAGVGKGFLGAQFGLGYLFLQKDPTR